MRKKECFAMLRLILRKHLIESNEWAWLGINDSRLLKLRLVLLPRFEICPLLKRFVDKAAVCLDLKVCLSLILKLPRALSAYVISLRGALEENVEYLSLRLSFPGWQQAGGWVSLGNLGGGIQAHFIQQKSRSVWSRALAPDWRHL